MECYTDKRKEKEKGNCTCPNKVRPVPKIREVKKATCRALRIAYMLPALLRKRRKKTKKNIE